VGLVAGNFFCVLSRHANDRGSGGRSEKRHEECRRSETITADVGVVSSNPMRSGLSVQTDGGGIGNVTHPRNSRSGSYRPFSGYCDSYLDHICCLGTASRGGCCRSGSAKSEEASRMNAEIVEIANGEVGVVTGRKTDRKGSER
jgi:hypothetical protein